MEVSLSHTRVYHTRRYTLGITPVLYTLGITPVWYTLGMVGCLLYTLGMVGCLLYT